MHMNATVTTRIRRRSSSRRTASASPIVLLGQKHGDVGAETRQCSGEKKVDGIEAA
jgi:hypothetical protein